MTRGLRHPPAARGRLAHERASLPLCGDPLRTSRRRSVHDRGVRCLSGSVRRGKLHREGHLRRRRVRASDARPLSREHAPQPRPDRRDVRARRTRDRHRGLRRLSDALSHLHAPQASLDSRRLAAAALARAEPCRDPMVPSRIVSRRSRAGRSSTTCDAAWSRSRSSSCSSPDGSFFPDSPVRWTGVVLLAIASPWIVSLASRCLRPPRDQSWRAYYLAVGRDAMTNAQQFVLAVIFLPHQAWFAPTRSCARCSDCSSQPPEASRVADGVAGGAMRWARDRSSRSGARCGRSRRCVSRSASRSAFTSP